MDLREWIGESVRVYTNPGSEEHIGKVKSASGNALILIPSSGKKTPKFFDKKEIDGIMSAPIVKDVVPKTNEAGIRIHLLKMHSYNAPFSTPKDLMVLHAKMHEHSDRDDYGRYGHIHAL